MSFIIEEPKKKVLDFNEVTLNISSNIVGDSNDEVILPHKLLLINTQVSKLWKAFANNCPANVKL